MAQYLVLKVGANDVPPLGLTGGADVYRGDHPTEQDAINAASAQWKLNASVRLWAVPVASLTRYVSAVSCAVG